MCSDEDDGCCDLGLGPVVERRFMLTLVWSLITFAYFSYYFAIVLPWEYYGTVSGVMHLLFFNTVVGLLVFSYIKAIFTNAGDASKDYVRSASLSRIHVSYRAYGLVTHLFGTEYRPKRRGWAVWHPKWSRSCEEKSFLGLGWTSTDLVYW